MSDSAPTGFEIAVIGMACRFPGAADIDTFWSNLRAGVCSIRFFSAAELAHVNPALRRHPDYVPAKGLLEDIEHFDADFFGYSPREAETMDPQLRLLLTCCWEALEQAGYPPGRCPGGIGLYAGAAFNDGWILHTFATLRRNQGLGGLETALLVLRDYLTTQVSYKLDLRGPSLLVQTACSTSLVAVHQACQALLAGECSLALAGGVCVTLPKVAGYLYQEGGIYSPDGLCRAFDAEGRGTVFGDGVGVVALKCLEDAVRDGDTVHAVIKGSAVNNDGGRKAGYTAPGTLGQAAVIRAAQRAARIDPETIDYVEAHGTGTALGDPIEVEALIRAFKTARRGFCGLGSVKPNLGHLNTAAGIASLLKTVLALKHGEIPPTLHYRSPNPRIDFAHSPFYVCARRTPWPDNGHPRRAGVSSFGLGGTNAHLVLEEAPPPRRDPDRRPRHLLVLSAKTPHALEALARRMGEHLRERADAACLADVAYTLQVGREAFAQRRYVVASSVREAGARLLNPGREGPTDAAALELEQLGARWQTGLPVDWSAGWSGERRGRLPLPTYVFEKTRYWPELQSELFLDRAAPAEPPVPPAQSAAPPADAVEHRLAGLWCELLGVEAVGPSDDFFALGGHSLTAARLRTLIHREFAVELALDEIFSAATLRALAQRIGQAGPAGRERLEPIPALGGRPFYDLSPAQERVYRTCRAFEVGTAYNFPLALWLEGPLDPDRFERTFQRMIERHENFRTTFEEHDGRPVQRIHPPGRFALERERTEPDRIPALIRRFVRPFDFARAPLLRAALAELGPERHLLLLDMHNLVCDGMSINIFVRDFGRFYHGQPLPAPALQYKDYAAWHNERLRQGELREQERYWLERFADGVPRLDLPLDLPRPPVREFRGDNLKFSLGGASRRRLESLARSRRATLNGLLLALYGLLIHRHTGQRDLVVGSLAGSRPHPDLEPVIGLFTNPLPIRLGVEPEQAFTAFLDRVQQDSLQAYSHQDYPFERLVERLDLAGDPSRPPLIQTLFVYHNEIDAKTQLELEGLRIAVYDFNKGVTHWDFKLDVIPFPDRLECVLQYNLSLFQRATLERLAADFRRLVDRVLEAPEQPVGALAGSDLTRGAGGRAPERAAGRSTFEAAVAALEERHGPQLVIVQRTLLAEAGFQSTRALASLKATVDGFAAAQMMRGPSGAAAVAAAGADPARLPAVEDLREAPHPESSAYRRLLSDIAAPFEPGQPLWRIRLMRLPREQWLIGVTAHLLAADGAILERFLDAWARRYAATGEARAVEQAAGYPKPPPPDPAPDNATPWLGALQRAQWDAELGRRLIEFGRKRGSEPLQALAALTADWLATGAGLAGGLAVWHPVAVAPDGVRSLPLPITGPGQWPPSPGEALDRLCSTAWDGMALGLLWQPRNTLRRAAGPGGFRLWEQAPLICPFPLNAAVQEQEDGSLEVLIKYRSALLSGEQAAALTAAWQQYVSERLARDRSGSIQAPFE